MTIKTAIFGHRGYPARFPENSLVGFSYALDHHIDGLEFDVQLTKDRVPVILHDATLERTSDGTGWLKQYTLAELRRFHLARGEAIPTLVELLELVGQRDVQLNLEFKTNQVRYPGIEKIVLETLRDFSLARPVIFSSFRLASLRACQSLAPDESYCWLADHPVVNAAAFVANQHLSGLHLRHYQHAAVTERIWTVDDPRLACELFAQPVAGIFTDDFMTMRRLRDRVLQVK
ncbi:glycerophosphodiester phosphodiesterase family protein [Levilactobacillus zymae]|uniref:glycerophosphodiester phosphodiesterase n=1 Tax=Levilactobacillus zymae TaxID=267363 RepID=UPI0028BD02E9|nr:glycerophosphodiester phosphodiesterase family protein [Levilactobacillus zymae]MDT6980537.1 glycerophosphodiester phosphodiesterase family protein [Levilactobacillus zymae]